jgi:hypothetical protein
VASVRKRTIPTERPPLVSKVSANFFRIEGATWSAWRIPTTYSRLSRPEPLLFLPSSSSVVLTRLSGPRSRLYIFFLVVPGNRTRDLWICSQELWPLDHRGGQPQVLNPLCKGVLTSSQRKNFISMLKIKLISFLAITSRSMSLTITHTRSHVRRTTILLYDINGIPLIQPFCKLLSMGGYANKWIWEQRELLLPSLNASVCDEVTVLHSSAVHRCLQSMSAATSMRSSVLQWTHHRSSTC